MDNRATVYMNTQSTVNDTACCVKPPKLNAKESAMCILEKVIDCHAELNRILVFIDSEVASTCTDPVSVESVCLNDCLEKVNLELNDIRSAIGMMKDVLGL